MHYLLGTPVNQIPTFSPTQKSRSSTIGAFNYKYRDLLIIGGRQNAYTCTPDIYMLNKVTHSGEAIGHIPSARDSAAVVSTADNKVVVIGGRSDTGELEATNTVWVGSCESQ